MNDDMLKQPLVFDTTHFNWSISGAVSKAHAQITFCRHSLDFLIYPGEGHSKEFVIPFAEEDAPRIISEMIVNQGRKIISVLCLDSTFSGDNIITTESTALIGMGGRSAEKLTLVVFLLDPCGQAIRIENQDFHTLCIESSNSGFDAYQESSSGGYYLDLFNVSDRFSSDIMQIELNVDKSLPTLSYDQTTTKLNSSYSIREIIEFLAEEDQYVVVLFCGNYFSLDDSSLDDLGSLSILATSSSGEFVMLAATDGCEGRLRDREGFVYHLSFDEDGLNCEQEDGDIDLE